MSYCYRVTQQPLAGQHQMTPPAFPPQRSLQREAEESIPHQQLQGWYLSCQGLARTRDSPAQTRGQCSRSLFIRATPGSVWLLATDHVVRDELEIPGRGIPDPKQGLVLASWWSQEGRYLTPSGLDAQHPWFVLAVLLAGGILWCVKAETVCLRMEHAGCTRMQIRREHLSF